MRTTNCLYYIVFITRETFLNNGCMKRYQGSNGYNILTALVKCAFSWIENCKDNGSIIPHFDRVN